MQERYDALRAMLLRLKSRPGCNLDELVDTLPESYESMDYNPKYLVLESMTALVRWGLAEAWQNDELVAIEQLEKANRRDWPQDITFYISKTCLELENTFEFSFDASPVKLFGTPKRHYAWPEVFVLMPFVSHLRPVYDDHIKKVITGRGLSIGRADDLFTNGSIVADIWSAINAASIIIADCTGRNSNVFYEIGLAHSVGKDTILISRTLDDIPFDLRQLRVIVYDFDPRGMEAFEVALDKTVANLRVRYVRHGTFKANDAAPQTITAAPDGWARCPGCGFRFDSRNEKFYGFGRHKRCGQRLIITVVP